MTKKKRRWTSQSPIKRHAVDKPAKSVEEETPLDKPVPNKKDAPSGKPAKGVEKETPLDEPAKGDEKETPSNKSAKSDEKETPSDKPAPGEKDVPSEKPAPKEANQDDKEAAERNGEVKETNEEAAPKEKRRVSSKSVGSATSTGSQRPQRQRKGTIPDTHGRPSIE